MNKIIVPKVTKIWSTPDARRAVAVAGRVCYSSIPVMKLVENLGEDEIHKMVTRLLENHHTSTFRHASLMVAVSGVSRAFSHQLVRHTAGMAYEQRSQHYRNEKDFNVIMPASFPVMESDQLIKFYERAQDLYDEWVSEGLPREDARMVLPNGVETVLVWTMNLEAGLNFCKARCCRLNNYEIVSVAAQVRKIILEDFPEMKNHLGPTCFTQGTCFEGKRYYEQCNMPWKTAVLWSPKFPEEIEIISANKAKEKVINVI